MGRRWEKESCARQPVWDQDIQRCLRSSCLAECMRPLMTSDLKQVEEFAYVGICVNDIKWQWSFFDHCHWPPLATEKQAAAHAAARRTIPERTLAPDSFFQSAIFTRVGCFLDPKSKNLLVGPSAHGFCFSESASLWRRFLVDCTIMCHQAEHRGKWFAFSNKNILYQYHIQQSHLQNHPWVMHLPKHGSHQRIHHKSGFLTGCPETTASHTIRREPYQWSKWWGTGSENFLVAPMMMPKASIGANMVPCGSVEAQSGMDHHGWRWWPKGWNQYPECCKSVEVQIYRSVAV